MTIAVTRMSHHLVANEYQKKIKYDWIPPMKREATWWKYLKLSYTTTEKATSRFMGGGGVQKKKILSIIVFNDKII